MPGTIEVLEATVEGLQYELHVCEIRLKEKDRRIAELEQQVEELRKQAVVTSGPAAGNRQGSASARSSPFQPAPAGRKAFLAAGWMGANWGAV